MKRKALFLQDLPIKREEASNLLKSASNDVFEPVWFDDPFLSQMGHEIEIIITRNHRVGTAELEPYGGIQMVSCAFTGHDDVDFAYCDSRRIALYYLPDYSSDSVAELAVGLTLALLRWIPGANEDTKNGNWDRNGVIPGIELHGKKVGILGAGRIGTKTARLFRAFGCAVHGWSRSISDEFKTLGYDYSTGPVSRDFFSEADIVSIHLPLTDQTKHIVSDPQFRLMKASTLLVNTARSELVNQRDLAKALAEKQIRGAAIDLTKEEHAISASELLKLRNLIVTPHLGFQTTEALYRLSREAIQNVSHYLAGQETNRLRK